VSSGDLGIEDSENVKDTDGKNQELFICMKDLLADKVKDVRASQRLKHHPVCLANAGELSIEMEKILNAMPNNQNIKADKILEINTNHEVFTSLTTAFENDKDKLKLYTDLLYNQALLIEGLPLDDPVSFSNLICNLMADKI